MDPLHLPQSGPPTPPPLPPVIPQDAVDVYNSLQKVLTFFPIQTHDKGELLDFLHDKFFPTLDQLKAQLSKIPADVLPDLAEREKKLADLYNEVYNGSFEQLPSVFADLKSFVNSLSDELKAILPSSKTGG